MQWTQGVGATVACTGTLLSLVALFASEKSSRLGDEIDKSFSHIALLPKRKRAPSFSKI